MRRTNLRGHALRSEGNPYLRDAEGGTHRVNAWNGRALCECGETSGVLDSNRQRKLWHAGHKDQVRQQQAGDRDG